MISMCACRALSRTTAWKDPDGDGMRTTRVWPCGPGRTALHETLPETPAPVFFDDLGTDRAGQLTHVSADGAE